MDMNYFTILTRMGKLDFGKQCNKVDYKNDKFLKCYHEMDHGTLLLLALIPYSSVLYVLNNIESDI